MKCFLELVNQPWWGEECFKYSKTMAPQQGNGHKLDHGKICPASPNPVQCFLLVLWGP